MALIAGISLVCLFSLLTERTVITLLGWFGHHVELREDVVVGDSWTAFDDYFYFKPIDANTFAILEPRYYQKNISYLILGDTQAVLFDSGPGIRNIREVVDRLTDLPVMAIASHLHYDHVGNLSRFKNIALPDISELRKQFSSDDGELTSDQFLGKIENFKSPKLKVSFWLSDRQYIDLGSRTLEVIHTPGHTSESIVLVDQLANYVFSGDLLYSGLLIGFGPRSHQGDYLRSVTTLVQELSSEVVIMGGHAGDGPQFGISSSYSELNALAASLERIKNGEQSFKAYPLFYAVHPKSDLMMPFPWNMRW